MNEFPWAFGARPLRVDFKDKEKCGQKRRVKERYREKMLTKEFFKNIYFVLSEGLTKFNLCVKMRKILWKE